MRNFTLSRRAVSLPLAVLVAALLIFVNETGFQKSRTALVQMDKSASTRATVNKLVQLLLTAETGQRGYLLTGEERYLEPYNAALADVNQTMDELRTLISSTPAELASFAMMASSMSGKLAEMEMTVRMRKNGKSDAWKFVVTTDVGLQQMDAIRQQGAKLVSVSTQKLAQGEAQIAGSLQLSRIGIALLALTSLLFFYRYLQRTQSLLESGERENDALQRERDHLDLQVKERTAKLTELATHLQNAREDERGHLARELHDELGALLTAAKLDVARLKSRLPPNLPEVLERLAHLTNTLNSGIALKRRIVEDLRPSSLTHLGLVASLEILAREFEERSALLITTDLEQVELDDTAQLTVYRLVQESLTNIGKYAEATQINISLQNMESDIAIEVYDNGKGFDVGKVAPNSHGLTGMRHRVEAGGGRLTITSEKIGGTRIYAVLPKAA